MSDVTQLNGHAEALRLHLDAVLEELNFFIKNAGNEKLKPFVQDSIAEFDVAWASFKVALAEV